MKRVLSSRGRDIRLSFPLSLLSFSNRKIKKKKKNGRKFTEWTEFTFYSLCPLWPPFAGWNLFKSNEETWFPSGCFVALTDLAISFGKYHHYGFNSSSSFNEEFVPSEAFVQLTSGETRRRDLQLSRLATPRFPRFHPTVLHGWRRMLHPSIRSEFSYFPLYIYIHSGIGFTSSKSIIVNRKSYINRALNVGRFEDLILI